VAADNDVGAFDAQAAWAAPSWKQAAADYHKDRGTRRSIVEIVPADLARLRRLMRDDVSMERAWHEMCAARLHGRAAEATLRAAEYLVRQRDPERLRAWLAGHSAAERAAIQRHLKGNKP
jgi:hypothetical protein